ncbi:hypothetical protein HAP41_0000002075 [Bradyrhizobium barranii subsp. apii]|uniref:Uncharacterized protein n=1 Tax=Bradyrhizobium barranii subsp. apii TaxID=2819348 RepID=A0A8T5V073_9BRAD|nr:hypothetical protein [Bradyrhizobium barranii]UPT87970.1 hypothetical protein HAP41_0000002075 [Bradyrhizobium barranii subsp. apii]
MTDATDIVRTEIAAIDNRACYSGFDVGRVSTPARTEKTNVSRLADSASRRSGEVSDMQEAAE